MGALLSQGLNWGSCFLVGAAVYCGGVPRGALVLVLGAPGSGKTTLVGQIAFATARAGQRVLLLTALSEATSKLVTHLRGFRFFEESLLGNLVQVLSLQASLQQGQDAMKDALVDMARRQNIKAREAAPPPGIHTLLLGAPGVGKTLLGLHFLLQDCSEGTASNDRMFPCCG